jgi:uncharacterized protein with FMN-binding domain
VAANDSGTDKNEHDSRAKGLRHNLVALGSAVVLTVYAAGYERTADAARRFANDGDDRPPPPGAHPGRARPVRPQPLAPRRIDAPAHASIAAKRSAASNPHDATRVASHERRNPVTPRDSTRNVVANGQAAPTASTPSTPSAPTPAPAPPSPSAGAAAATIGPAPSTPQATPAAKTTDAAASDTAAAASYKDGTFTGWGTSRHGDVQATIMIKNGRIFFAAISECLTEYSCSWITALPPEVVERQSAEVDYVSGATQSTRAFYYAVLQALSKAK